MNAKCLYTKCTPHFDPHFVYKISSGISGIVLSILHTKCIKKFVDMWYTFCIHQLCIHLVQFLYAKCMHSFRVGWYSAENRKICLCLLPSANPWY